MEVNITMSNALTIEQFQSVMPTKAKKNISQQLVDNINKTMSDPILRESYRDNLLSYSRVMNEGRIQIEKYIDAVRYVSFKLMGDDNRQAYIKTFPDRYQRLVNEGKTLSDIDCYVHGYNKTKVVQLVFEQTLTPVHVLNADLFQKALNTQAELMLTAKSEKVRSDACDSVMRQTRPPESAKLEIDVKTKDDGAISELRAATLALAAQQREMIQAGAVSAKDVAESKIIHGTVVDSEEMD